MQPATAVVARTLAGITPFDSLERQHLDQTMSWLRQTDDIFRRIEPATPARHLASYVVLVDPGQRGIYLGQHRKSNLHLPMGGHVEPGEHPRQTARREAAEELDIVADFSVIGDRPLFVTMTTTVGRDAGHEDVSLWYVIRGSRSREYHLAPTEFDAGRWWDIDPYAIPESDPHLGRFLTKLHAALSHVEAE
ncbi:NUDIX domain-containing protein [Nocardia sp. NPDC051570]|uniref:NUDIX domain-containing protein n=1 Tax=Nocardia sp. NPDC051570 TaxID=3364324 RepID=UPI0037B9F050